MATFYIDPSGSDTVNTGSISSPWKTLYKATSTVTTSGNTIFVNAGTYVETQVSSLSPGVNIDGTGNTSIIKSTISSDWGAILRLESNTEGTNGNQFIRNLKFDGNNLTTHVGIIIAARKNVEVYNLTIVDFLRVGCSFSGVTGWLSPYTPTVYATGNSFHDCIVTNCSVWITAQGYGTGCVQFGGQDGFLCYNNTITQPSRGNGGQYIGWPLKMANEGHLKNCKVYNNILVKEPWTGAQGMDNGWNFAAEFWHIDDFEWYGNDIQGAVDLVAAGNNSTSYGLWFHDNYCHQPTLNRFHYEDGLYLEVDQKNVIIENNRFENLSCGVSYTVHTFPFVGLTDIGMTNINNLTIRKNLMVNIGGNNNGGLGNIVQAYGIRAYDASEPEGDINGLYIYNNTIIGATGNDIPLVGIKIPTAETNLCQNVNIINNIVTNVSYTPVYANAGASIDHLNIKNNNFYNTGSAFPVTSVTLTNYVNSGNITTNPNLDSNYRPNVGSPVIDAGIDVGLSYNGSAPDIGYFETSNGFSANAGVDTKTTTNTNKSLSGSYTLASGTTLVSTVWSVVSGSGTIVSGGSTLTPVVKSTVQGATTYRLTVTDSASSTDTDDIVVNFYTPSVSVGNDITLPVNLSSPNISITPTVNGGNDLVSSVLWQQLSGSIVSFSATTLSTTFQNIRLTTGTYSFRCTINYIGGATASDDVTITITDNGNVVIKRKALFI